MTSYTQPIFDTEVYAVRPYGRAEIFLGYASAPEDWTERALALSDGWVIEERSSVEPSILDEWTGTDVEVADYGSVSYETWGTHEKWGTPLFHKRTGFVVDEEHDDFHTIDCLIRTEHAPNAKAIAERVAWDEMQNRLAFRSAEVDAEYAGRFERRGEDAGAGASDVLTQQRRARSDREVSAEARSRARAIPTADNRRFASAMSERERYRRLLELFGQDPDAPHIREWKNALHEAIDPTTGQMMMRTRTYRELADALQRKAERDGLLAAA